MITVLIPIASSLLYLVVAGFRYRAEYRTQRTSYLRWQNEKPDKMERYSYDYYRSEATRKDISWYNYRTRFHKGFSPTVEALAWPLLVWGKPLASWLHPEVKIPSVVAIDMLEDLIPEVDHGLCSSDCPEQKA